MPSLPSFLFSLRGFGRWVRAGLLRDKVHRTGHCLMCGKCCKSIMLSDEGKWLRNRRDLKALIKKEPEYARFRITGNTTCGRLLFTCSLLGEDNLCGDHENRLFVCREYPTIALYFEGGDTGTTCGYSIKATTFRGLFGKKRETPPAGAFTKVLKSEIRRSDTETKS